MLRTRLRAPSYPAPGWDAAAISKAGGTSQGTDADPKPQVGTSNCLTLVCASPWQQASWENKFLSASQNPPPPPRQKWCLQAQERGSDTGSRKTKRGPTEHTQGESAIHQWQRRNMKISNPYTFPSYTTWDSPSVSVCEYNNPQNILKRVRRIRSHITGGCGGMALALTSPTSLSYRCFSAGSIIGPLYLFPRKQWLLSRNGKRLPSIFRVEVLLKYLKKLGNGVSSPRRNRTWSIRAAAGTCTENDKRLVQRKCAVRVKHTGFKGVARKRMYISHS